MISTEKVKHTNKPCPGCGEEGYREADSVCSKCKNTLILAWDEEGRKARREKAGEVRYKTLWHRRFSFSYAGFHSKLGEAMTTLLNLLATEIEKNAGHTSLPLLIERDARDTIYGTSVVTIKQVYADVIRELDTEIVKALENAYKDGKQSGSSLLLKLASNEMTVSDFNERSQK